MMGVWILVVLPRCIGWIGLDPAIRGMLGMLKVPSNLVKLKGSSEKNCVMLYIPTRFHKEIWRSNRSSAFFDIFGMFMPVLLKKEQVTQITTSGSRVPYGSSFHHQGQNMADVQHGESGCSSVWIRDMDHGASGRKRWGAKLRAKKSDNPSM